MPRQEDELSPSATETRASQDGAQRDLRRIADALEKGNEMAKKNGASQDGDGEAAEDGEEKKKEGKEDGHGHQPSKKAIVIGVLIVAVLAAVGVWFYLRGRNRESTEDAYVAGHVHEVSARIAGTVEKVEVEDNQTVEAGQILVRLDPRDYQASRDQAAASLAQAEASALQARAQVAEKQAEVSENQAAAEQQQAQVQQYAAQRDLAKITYDRNLSLYKRDEKAVPKADVDNAEGQLKSAEAQLAAARANLASSQAKTRSAVAAVQAAEANVKVADANGAAARASLEAADLQLSYCRVLAPVRGKISRKTVETGQRLSAGQALLAVVPDEVWILANFKETQLEHVAVGQRVDVKIDALSSQIFIGSIESIQEGTGATFALLPPDNATGNFTKIVQRVPVKIVFDEDSVRDFKERIVPGLSVVPTIDVASRPGAPKSRGMEKREEQRQEKKDEQNRQVEEGRQ